VGLWRARARAHVRVIVAFLCVCFCLSHIGGASEEVHQVLALCGTLPESQDTRPLTLCGSTSAVSCRARAA